MVDSERARILVPMRGKKAFGGAVLGLTLFGAWTAPALARDAMPANEAARGLAARHELSKCMLQHMLADRMLSYNGANSLCLGLRRAPREQVADQTPGTMRKSRTTPSPKASSAA